MFGKIRIQSLRSCKHNCGSPVGERLSSSLGSRVAAVSPTSRSLLPALDGNSHRGDGGGRKQWWAGGCDGDEGAGSSLLEDSKERSNLKASLLSLREKASLSL